MLNRSSYFIREHVGMFKLSDTYDILDPETSEQIGIAKEMPGGLILFLRFLVNKRMLPTKIHVYEGADAEATDLVFTIKRGFTIFRSRIDVIGKDGELVGWFKSKAFSLGGAFRVFDADDNEVALVKGDWKGWNFRFLVGDQEIGTVTKKWAGLGKELFTSADNYMIDITGETSPQKSILLLAAGLAIDTVYKEK